MAFKNTFRLSLIEWYHEHKRDLPWRKTKDPYIIWLSEIILQQTRVNQGLPYFHKFVDHYPNVYALASASEDEVLRDWQGLGYYTRARNLKKAAEVVVREHEGKFPESYVQLIGLPGVGDYTAAAVSSFSANEVKPVLDGNVFRVLSRIFGVSEPINTPSGKKIFHALADEMLDPLYPGLYNQAIMEFGALHCKPVNPECSSCIFKRDCVAYREKRVRHLPVKIKAKPPKVRFLNYLLIEDEGRFLIRQRDETGIWAKMYEFPLLETLSDSLDETGILDNLREDWFSDVHAELVWGPVRHLLSHQKIFVRVFRLHNWKRSEEVLSQDGYRFVDVDEFSQLAKPKIIQVFLEYFQHKLEQLR